MDDLDAFIEARKAGDPEFAKGFELGYQKFKLGVLLRQAREEAGLTQEQVAQLLPAAGRYADQEVGHLQAGESRRRYPAFYPGPLCYCAEQEASSLPGGLPGVRQGRQADRWL